MTCPCGLFASCTSNVESCGGAVFHHGWQTEESYVHTWHKDNAVASEKLLRRLQKHHDVDDVFAKTVKPRSRFA